MIPYLKHKWEETVTTDYDGTIFDKIVAAYSESHRSYHNLKHLEECFRFVDKYGISNSDLSLAIFFHDFVYVPGRKDNEELSAEAYRKLMDNNELVYNLILSTKNHSTEGIEFFKRGNTIHSKLADYLFDIDKSILASDFKRYKEYYNQISEEYKEYSDIIYISKREEFLKQEIIKDNIFIFYPELNSKARENMLEEYANLNSKLVLI